MTETSTHTLGNGATKRLERSRSDRKLAGVAGGLARYFDIHPAVYRVGFVVLTLLGGAGILIYLAAALVMPDEGHEDSFATAALRNRRDRPWPVIGLGLVAVGLASLLSRASLWPHGDAWIVLLIAGAAILWITRHSKAATADAGTLASEDSRRIRRVFKRIAITLATLFALLLVAAAVVAATFNVHLGNGVGDRSYLVAGTQDLRSTYKLGIGDMTLDLRNVRFTSKETHVKARVDIGNLRVIVPQGVALQVRGGAQLGEVNILGRSDDGRHAKSSITQTGKHVLVLDTHVGVGQVRVTRAVQ
jgi:phage shock protein PspC (stress-responsive transcriptional regulator)/predicted membrane protein